MRPPTADDRKQRSATTLLEDLIASQPNAGRGAGAYTARPVTSLIIITITAITKIMWIKPPATWNENPRSHKMSKITAIVQSMISPIFAVYQ